MHTKLPIEPHEKYEWQGEASLTNTRLWNKTEKQNRPSLFS